MDFGGLVGSIARLSDGLKGGRAAREVLRGSRFGNLVGLVGRGDERKTASKKMESASRRILTVQ